MRNKLITLQNCLTCDFHWWLSVVYLPAFATTRQRKVVGNPDSLGQFDPGTVDERLARSRPRSPYPELVHTHSHSLHNLSYSSTDSTFRRRILRRSVHSTTDQSGHKTSQSQPPTRQVVPFILHNFVIVFIYFCCFFNTTLCHRYMSQVLIPSDTIWKR